MVSKPCDVISDWQMQEALEQSFGEVTSEMQMARDKAVRWIDGWTEVGLLPTHIRVTVPMVENGKPLRARLPQGARACSVKFGETGREHSPVTIRQEDQTLLVYTKMETWPHPTILSYTLSMQQHQIPGSLRAACLVLAVETYENMGRLFKPNQMIEYMIAPFIQPWVRLHTVKLDADFTRERA